MEKRLALVLLSVLAIMLTLPACSTKTSEPTATLTPTATPIPEPGWSFFSSETDETEDIKRLAFDQDGYLWVIGYGGVMRWDIDAGTYHEYSQKDGLGSAPRGAILVDQGNNVWVVAEDGIYKFDGESWTTYPSPSPLGTGQFLEDAAGNLWLCGTQGLFQFDGEEWVQHGVQDGLPSDTCYELAIDSEGSPWVIAAKNTISQYTAGWETYEADPDGVALYGDLIDGGSKIHISPSGELWFSNIDRAVSFDPVEMTWFLWAFPLDIGTATAFTLSSSGTPWMASQEVGMSIFQAFNGESWNLMMQSGYEDGLDMSFNMAMADPDGAVWFMGEDVFIRTMQHEWTVFKDAHGAWNSFHNQGTFSEDGRLFFTVTEGILALGENDEDVTLYEKPITGLLSNKVDELQIDAEGNVYVLIVQPLSGKNVTDVIQIYDGASWTTLRESFRYKPNSRLPTDRGFYRLTAAQDCLAHKYGKYGRLGCMPASEAIERIVIDMIKDGRGDIWLTHGDQADALSHWDGESFHIVEIDSSAIQVEGKRNTGLYQAFLSSQGSLWFAVSYRNQWLASYDDATGTWTCYPPDPQWEEFYGHRKYIIADVQINAEDMPVVLLEDDGHELNPTRIYEYRDGVWTTLEFDGAAIRTIRYHENTLWVGTEDDGVYYRDDGGSGEWERLDDSTWEGGTRVRLIAPGAENDLWIATQSCISVLREGTWTYFPQSEIHFQNVCCMAVAPDGAVWFGSDSRGIARYGLPW